MVRENNAENDLAMADACLSSLENSTFNTVVVYNQGFISNAQLQDYLTKYTLETIVLGEGVNAGIVAGRQHCFKYIWEHFPDSNFISELHMDMIFSSNWEDPLIAYLERSNEPMVGCGIIDRQGEMPFSEKSVSLPPLDQINTAFLKTLQEDRICPGFTNPCIHASRILKEIGGYNTQFLTGKQCFEDDSMLLGYFYYYGTRAAWHPKINLNSVVYHAVAGQRLTITDDIKVNYNGLVRQYGAMGLSHLSCLHQSQWHKHFFAMGYNDLIPTKAERTE